MEQRKLVTVLFCDLVGSTELSGILEPELLRSIVLRYFDTARERIEGHGGTVEKFIGDAVMAVFGVPVVREDDARRGTAAALDIIAGLDELNVDLEESFGCRLAVRIGVNTGEVVATSAVGANENLVAGEVVNVAARLEQNAGPGEVLIGPVTRALLGSTADVEEVGALALKGKRDPVIAYRVHSVQTHADRTLPSDVPFVGRAAELGVLADRWAEVLQGRGQHLTISGEAGIGKTRLIQEWLPANAFVGAGRCHPYRDQASLAPLAQAVRGILDAAETQAGPHPAAAQVGTDGPALQLLRSGLLRDGAPGHSADATFHAVATVLTDLAATHPVVLVIDDLQWADRTLLEGITQLAESLKAARVMLVCAGRGLTDAAVTLHVTPLTPDESARLAAELVPVQAHGPTVLDRVIDRAEGNPLYLEQLVAMLDDGADPDTLPVTVTAVLAARIDALDAPDRVVLDAAAVVGRQFAANKAVTLAESSASVGELMRRGLVEPAARDYRFHSGLLRDVTYHGISKRRRADWHEQLAAQDATGHHLEQAYLHRHGLGMRDAHTSGLRCQAAEVLTSAARTALGRADLSWAEDLGSRALSLTRTDDPWWTTAAQVVAETRIATGDPATELLQQIIDIGDAKAAAHARLQLPASPKDRAETARQALPTFETENDHLGQARCLIRIAQEQQIQGNHAAAEQLLTNALTHAEAAPEQAMALGALGISLWHGPAQAAQATRRCRALLAEHDHDVIALTLNYPLANLLALQGEHDQAKTHLQAAERFARELGYAEAAIVGPLFAAGVAALAGRLDEAERLLRETLRQANGIESITATTRRELARILLRQGKPAEFTPADNLAAPEAADQLGIQARITQDPELAEEAVALALTTESPITQATAYLDLAATSGDGQAAERAEELFRGKGHVVGERIAARLRKAVR
ncbi:AAA family ATPase [Lentzea sp. JNUCC 0626]|uniref:AAA family ATPase n=1 Tax=Lentzea sp. JNUCC 0626 TaxID=3367513 RepID=UPI00374A888B